ncbi:MAG TPA: oligosaccharide flippase family protein [bacterium]|nr:oligosaccharide flippase family protein [bacterium]
MITLKSIQAAQAKYLPAGSLRNRLATGTFWSLTGSTFNQFLSLAGSIIFARILGKSVYGEWGIIFQTVSMFGVFAAMGLGLTTNKHIAQLRNSDPERAGRIIGMTWMVACVTGGLVGGFFLIFAPYVATHIINAPHLAVELRIAGVVLFIYALNSSQTGGLSGFEAFKTLAILRFIMGLVQFPASIAGVYFWGLRGAVMVQAAISIFSWLVYHLVFRWEAKKAGLRISFRNLRSELPVLWSFSLPSLLTNFTFIFAMWVINTFLVNQAGGYADLGLFKAANQWRMALLFIPTVIGQTIIPMLSNTMGEGEKRSVLKIFWGSIGINGLASLIPGIGLVLLSPWIMSQYGEGFREGWPVMVVCIGTAVLISILSPVGTVIVASGKMWVGFILNLAWAVTLIIAAILFLPLGAMGLALAYLVAYLLHGAWTWLYAYFAILRKNAGIHDLPRLVVPDQGE